MGDTILRVENIRKSFNGDPILKGVDLSLGRGEIKILMGYSGPQCQDSFLLNLSVKFG